MNDLDVQEQRLLAGARRALSPNAADQKRVLASIAPTLALALSPSVSASPGTRARVAHYLLGVSALGVAVLAGYGWGYWVGAKARPAPAVAAPAVAVPGGTAPPAASNARPGVREPEASSRDVRAPVGRRSVAVAPTPSVAGPPPGLDEEVRQLRRIERAVREGNPRLALVIAEDLDQSIPRGQLLVERRAATLMASCQLGADGAEQVAADFLRNNPDSAYAARLREICKLAATPQRTSVGPGTDGLGKGGNP